MVSLNRKGFEVAVGTLVTMILGVIILGAGTLLVWQIVDEGTDVAVHLTGGVERELQQLLSQGKLVAVAPPSIELKAGETGTVGVGILNRRLEETTFFLSVPSGLDQDQFPIDIAPRNTPAPPSMWEIKHFEGITISANEKAFAAISITAPKDTPSGTYTFLVHVSEGTQLYDSARLFTVRVP